MRNGMSLLASALRPRGCPAVKSGNNVSPRCAKTKICTTAPLLANSGTSSGKVFHDENECVNRNAHCAHFFGDSMSSLAMPSDSQRPIEKLISRSEEHTSELQ